MSAEWHASRGEPAGDRSAPTVDGPSCILTASGDVISFTGHEPTHAFTAGAAAIARDAQRAARHLGLAVWETLVVESREGVLGLAQHGPDSGRLAAVAFPPATPVGAVQRAAIRHASGGARG